MLEVNSIFCKHKNEYDFVILFKREASVHVYMNVIEYERNFFVLFFQSI